MTTQIRSYSVAERNTNDESVSRRPPKEHSDRLVACCSDVRAGSAGIKRNARSGAASLQTEFAQLNSEIDRIARATDFNGVKMLNSDSSTVTFQVGVNGGETISVGMEDVVGMVAPSTTGVSNATASSAAIATLDVALDSINSLRTQFGSITNRLQVTVSNIQTMRTNLSAANSRIRDVDVADETATLSRYQVLQQAGIGILAQANVSSQSALTLLRG